MRTRLWARRPVMLAAALALAAILPACGGGSSGGGNSPTTLPPAPQPVRTQIAGGNFTLAGTDQLAGARLGFLVDFGTTPISVSGAGTLEIVADWTFASNDVDVLLYNGSCSSLQAALGQCPVANRTTSTTTKPERLTITGVPAGNYSVGFANYGRTSESGNFQVFLTR